jgi:hypothetical protein
MPKELVDFARQNGCTQVADFFDRPEQVGPPYVYGYLPGSKEGSAILWCEKSDAGGRHFFLLVMLTNEQQKQYEEASCPRRIEWLGGYPGGLEVYNGDEWLWKFVYMNDPKKSGPKGVRMAGNAIRTSFGGTASVLYCHKGRWLVRQWD